MRVSQKLSDEGPGNLPLETSNPTIEALKRAQAHIRICSRLEELLLKKRLLQYGDTPEIHAQKVDKLKVLSESLANSSVKAEKRISDARFQREEALKFRVTKETEVSVIEKEITAEISGLEKQRDELEAELKKVNISLAAAHKRLQNTKEEKDQFDEANNQIVAHLKTKEDELCRSVSSCRVEADVLRTWINFLEDTWTLQCSYAELKEKGANDELERHEEYFLNLAIDLLSGYKKELEPYISRARIFVNNLKNLSDGSRIGSIGDHDDSNLANPRKNLEEGYRNYEEKIIATFSVVDTMKEQLYAQQGKILRKDEAKVRGLFEDIEKLRQTFEAIERPILEMESPSVVGVGSIISDKSVESPPLTFEAIERPILEMESPSVVGVASIISDKSVEIPSLSVTDAEKEHVESGAPNEEALDHEAELAKLESEFGKVSPGYSTEEISGWEFDELEREFKFGDSASGV
ncbi:hypothetical protein Dimus_021104 [Dionaea muscipula]